ncbi:hypothetical protein ACS0TY_024459 [Phlomoides rotata]
MTRRVRDQLAAAPTNNSKPLLRIAYNVRFTPTHIASTTITKCIKQRLHKEGWTWKKVPQHVKEYYWNEFQKYFTFDRDVSVVRVIWERQAARHYSSIVCEWRRSGQRPAYVPQEIWDNWQRNWAIPAFNGKNG